MMTRLDLIQLDLSQVTSWPDSFGALIDDEYLTKNNENSESDNNNSKGKQTT